ncbi:MAG: hypothetical protein GX852_06590 [Clostridiales bacterium]|jgi:hypothetical protein|nr:hypothetical protein [Clostridiales bacterium]
MGIIIIFLVALFIFIGIALVASSQSPEQPEQKPDIEDDLIDYLVLNDLDDKINGDHK